MNDSVDQTRAVLLAKATTSDTAPPNLEPFLALQKLIGLERPRVVIPFARALALGCNPATIRIRRDFNKVLALIESHAILSKQHRQTNDAGQIVATLEDYEVVYDLVADLLAYGTGQKVHPEVRKTVEAVGDLTGWSRTHYGVKGKEVAVMIGASESMTSRRIRKSLQAGFLLNQELRPYFPQRLILGEPLPEEAEVIPTPLSLKNIYEGSSPHEIGATMQPLGKKAGNSDTSDLPTHLASVCNPSATVSGERGCNPLAGPDATDNYEDSMENPSMVAGLQEFPGDVLPYNSDPRANAQDEVTRLCQGTKVEI